MSRGLKSVSSAESTGILPMNGHFRSGRDHICLEGLQAPS